MQESPSGYTYISLDLPYDRAWASLGRALQKSRFEITDRDRSTGNYYARFLGPEGADEEGWLDWLWGGEDDHPLAGDSFVINIQSEDERTNTIRLRPQGDIEGYGKREEQSLLALIKGNINSKGDRIYHLPGSSSYGPTKINESRGERWFCSEEEARAAGWRAPRN